MKQITLFCKTERPSYSASETFYAHIRLYFSLKDTETKYCSYEPINGLWVENLAVTCQIDQNNHPGPSYAWDVEYRDVYSVDRTDAERMHKTNAARASCIQNRCTSYGALAGMSQVGGDRRARTCNSLILRARVKRPGHSGRSLAPEQERNKSKEHQ